MNTYKNFRIFDYFKNSQEDAFFGVNEIADDKSHSQYQNLQSDLKDLEPKEVEKYIAEKDFYHLIYKDEDVYFQMCIIFMIENIQHGIAKERLFELQNKDKLPSPYNSENLRNLEIDSNNLVLVKNFSFIPSGYRYNDYIYNLSPTINGSNSSYWISQTIMKYTFKEKLNFKIRLDPLIEIFHSDYSSIGYKMDVYGKSLDWERLKTLREDEHGQWMNEKLSNNNITDYVWKPTAKEIHFTCEELPNKNEVHYRGSRYFHAIIDKKTGLVKHCDGAIRIYSEDELEFRSKYHVRNSEVRKIGKRVKIFQLDDQIERKIFIDLITSYMVWNYDLIRYFN